jgi:hypothetical protein
VAGASLRETPRASLAHDIVHVDPHGLDLGYGVRAGAFTVVPLFLGLAFGQTLAGVLVTLGTLNVLLVQAPRPDTTPFRVLALAVATNALAWAVGTVVGTTSGPAEWVLVGSAVTLILLTKRHPLFNQLAVITAVMFVVAVGLPGGLGVALPHAGLVLVGGTWALVAIALPLAVRRITGGASEPPTAPASSLLPVPTSVSFALTLGTTVAVGLAFGQVLGLPRDYWIMLTILAAVRPELLNTFEFAVMRVVGTVAGAAVAYEVSRSTADPWFLAAIVVVTAASTFALRAVNYTTYAVSLTIFLVLLLDLAYGGGPQLAVDRVLATGIGGAFALVAGVALVLEKVRFGVLHRPQHPRGPTHPI